MSDNICTSCGGPIEVMAFRGTDFCSVECKKKGGRDVSSVGTIMFVSSDEKKEIDKARNKGTRLVALRQTNKQAKLTKAR